MNTKSYLLQHDIKPSVQRMAIMEYLMENKTHPTVDEIYLALADSIPTLSKTTVYNTLKLFIEKGAAQSLTIEEKNARFDGDMTPHAHFICSECGCIYDLPITPEQEALFAREIGDLSIEEIQVYYKGYCKTCKENHNQQFLNN